MKRVTESRVAPGAQWSAPLSAMQSLLAAEKGAERVHRRAHQRSARADRIQTPICARSRRDPGDCGRLRDRLPPRDSRRTGRDARGRDLLHAVGLFDHRSSAPAVEREHAYRARPILAASCATSAAGAVPAAANGDRLGGAVRCRSVVCCEATGDRRRLLCQQLVDDRSERLLFRALRRAAAA